MIGFQLSGGERAVVVVLAVLAGLGVFRDAIRAHRQPATAPRPLGEIHPALGGRSRPVLLVPGQVAPDDDEPHAGWPDLERWPMSLAEARIGLDCLNACDRYVELVEVAGSGPRALLILDRLRREQTAEHTLRRAL